MFVESFWNMLFWLVLFLAVVILLVVAVSRYTSSRIENKNYVPVEVESDDKVAFQESDDYRNY